METAASFETQLSELFRARFPMVYIPTWEEERALSAIRSLANDPNLIRTVREVLVWRVTTGILEQNTQKIIKDTTDPLKALDYIQQYDKPSLLVLLDAHVYFEGRMADSRVIRKIRDTVAMLKGGRVQKNVVLLSPRLVLPNELQKDITIVDFDLPDYRDIKQSLISIINANRGNTKIHFNLDEAGVDNLAKAAQGLTLQEAENAFARAMIERGCLDQDSVDIIVEEKRQIIKKTGVLEYVKSDLNMDDVGGLGNLKKWLKKRNRAWMSEAASYNLPAPKGVLITGVPGCGKSLTAKAISAYWKLPLLRMDIGRIFSGIVGSSEENMRNAIKTAEAVAPSILWIDEIEKGFSGVGGSNDSGTSTRVFGTFLTWMQEKKNPVFVVATANNIHALPSEMMRKGRFDEIFFVDLPTFEERKAIFRVHLKKRVNNKKVQGNFVWEGDNLDELAEKTEGFVGAEIENVVIAAIFEAFSEHRSVKMEDFLKAIDNTVPLAVTQAEQITAIREWANVRAVAATAPEDRKTYQQEKDTPSGAASDKKRKEESDAVLQQRGGRMIDL